MIFKEDKKRADAMGLNPLLSPKLKVAKAISKLVKALPDKYVKMFSHGSIYKKELHLYFIHPALAMEFNNNKVVLLPALREQYKKEGLKEFITFTEIVAKVKHTNPKKDKEINSDYLEKSTGNFKIGSKDPAIFSKFKDIQNNIRIENDKQTKSL